MRELPPGFTLRLDEAVETAPDCATLVGGNPRRQIRLTAAGRLAFASLHNGDLRSSRARRLAGRLVDAGIAVPIPGESSAAAALTVVIPTRNRSPMLARCLAGIPEGTPVIVVDDGSADARAVERVCAAHGAKLIRLAQNRGPAAARNTGLHLVQTEVVAFVDSDCLVPPQSLEQLSRHFADPRVGAVAPRVVPFAARPHSLIASISAAYRDLDMGEQPGLVGPSKVIPWVPSAVLLVRRAALKRAFDPELRCGEDVDLVWRLHDRGWNVRYEPAVVVMHHEPEKFGALLRRRHRYGTSVGPLAKRHPGRLPQIALSGATSASLCLALTRHYKLATILGTWNWLSGGRTPPLTLGTATSTGRTIVRFAAPLLAASTRHTGTRLLAGCCLAVPVIDAYRRHDEPSRPRRVAVALYQLLDDLAYGSGVWRGCRSAQTWAPLLPRGVA